MHPALLFISISSPLSLSVFVPVSVFLLSHCFSVILFLLSIFLLSLSVSFSFPLSLLFPSLFSFSVFLLYFLLNSYSYLLILFSSFLFSLYIQFSFPPALPTCLDSRFSWLYQTTTCLPQCDSIWLIRGRSCKTVNYVISYILNIFTTSKRFYVLSRMLWLIHLK